jgi:hypothetical protein
MPPTKEHRTNKRSGDAKTEKQGTASEQFASTRRSSCRLLEFVRCRGVGVFGHFFACVGQRIGSFGRAPLNQTGIAEYGVPAVAAYQQQNTAGAANQSTTFARPGPSSGAPLCGCSVLGAQAGFTAFPNVPHPSAYAPRGPAIASSSASAAIIASQLGTMNFVHWHVHASEARSPSTSSNHIEIMSTRRSERSVRQRARTCQRLADEQTRRARGRC